MTRAAVLSLLLAVLLAAPAAAAPVDLGPGRAPDVALDALGTAHVVLETGEQGALGVDYCRLPRRATGCEVRTALPLPAGEGRPRILRRADGLLIVAASRNVGTSWATFVLISADGGTTWSAPAVVGTALWSIAAIELTPDGQALDTLHVGSTTGHELQRIPLAGPPETRTIRLEDPNWAAHPALALVDGTTAYLRDGNGHGPLRQRTFAGGDLYAPAAWPARRFGPRAEFLPDAATGPRGTWLVTMNKRIPRRIRLRRLHARRARPRTRHHWAGRDARAPDRPGRPRPAARHLAGRRRAGLGLPRRPAVPGRHAGPLEPARPARVLPGARRGAGPLELHRAGRRARDGRGPSGSAAAVYRTNGGTVRYVRLAR